MEANLLPSVTTASVMKLPRLSRTLRMEKLFFLTTSDTTQKKKVREITTELSSYHQRKKFKTSEIPYLAMLISTSMMPSELLIELILQLLVLMPQLKLQDSS